jgi:hypothetical protein
LKDHNIDPNPSADIVDSLGSCIYHGCGGRGIEYFQDYYEKPKNEQVFVYTCANNSVKTAKWLVDNFNIDIHVDNNVSFLFSCRCGATKTAKWLCEYSQINHNKDIADDMIAFNEAICYGDTELVDFLYNLHPESFDIYENKLPRTNYLYTACYRLNIGVAKWIYEKCKIKEIYINDMISQDDFDCLYNYFDVRHPYEMYVIEWLLEISEHDCETPYFLKNDEKNSV